MKSKLIHLLTLVVFVIVLPVTGWSQGFLGLKVFAMPGFPVVPQDSAYEGQSYNFDVKLVNNTSNVINTPIDIQFRVDSITNIAFTVSQPALGINDTATFSITGYTFNQPQFKMGNNIVVVWPSVNGLSIPVDTFYADVYFIPLSSLGDNDLNNNLIGLYPIPAHADLFLKLNPDDIVEYVRIYTIDGRLVSDQPFISNGSIDIRHLRRGTYLLEALINGKSARARFIRQ